MDIKYRRFETSKAWDLPWDKPKVIVPASRMSRCPWRYAAAIDKSGRIVSRRFYGIWPKSEIFDVTTLAALLNSPIVEAFTYAHSFQKDIPKRVYAANVWHITNQWMNFRLVILPPKPKKLITGA